MRITGNLFDSIGWKPDFVALDGQKEYPSVIFRTCLIALATFALFGSIKLASLSATICFISPMFVKTFYYLTSYEHEDTEDIEEAEGFLSSGLSLVAAFLQDKADAFSQWCQT
ncbi:MAG: hypothetical protein HN411_04595 [Waddliaceae bacterium]|jgi:hypothetical protein|nr:hypothetical protein [Waddliaceae bacterium]MBT3579301.1 hypothetical protein [Waddliaceae bacterium]MBT4444259.1 hypothetical protein [Waddliaceae bacterium]MBT6928430.1 hypothetical protein [Waddliaceae bacterium]MBT7264076.1 hypothetical protein [Waddliaceae bacterium]